MAREIPQPSDPADLSSEELGQRLVVVAGEGISLYGLEVYFKEGAWLKFIVGPDFRVIIGAQGSHTKMIGDNRLKVEDCLIPDGAFKKSVDHPGGTRFDYSWGGLRPSRIRKDVVEGKIVEFLKQQKLVND